jgi:hypothetical protein
MLGSGPFNVYRYSIARAARIRADEILAGQKLTPRERENAAILIDLTEQMMDGKEAENAGFVRIRAAKEILEGKIRDADRPAERSSSRRSAPPHGSRTGQYVRYPRVDHGSV